MAVSDYQCLFNGLTIGTGTSYELFSIEGVDGWDVRTNDQMLPQLWGVQPGSDFVNARSITLGIQMVSSLAVTAPLEAAFLPATQASPSTLQALVFKVPDRPESQVMCRVRRRSRARTPETDVSITRWFVQLDAPDPRLYAYSQSTATAPPFVTGSDALNLTAGSGAGLAFDLTVSSGTGRAFDFTSVPATGLVTCRNDGNVDTYPTFVFTTSAGLLNSWTVTNLTTGETASFVYPIPPGQNLTVNMAGVATGITDPPVTANGTAAYSAWQTPRSPMRLVPGDNELTLTVTSGPSSGPSALISFRSAYL